MATRHFEDLPHLGNATGTFFLFYACHVYQDTQSGGVKIAIFTGWINERGVVLNGLREAQAGVGQVRKILGQ